MSKILRVAVLSLLCPIGTTIAQSFRATYKANFQYYQGFNCNGPFPVVRAYCKGTALTVVSTSDDTIECSPLSDDSGDYFASAVECVNTCGSTAACRNVWLNDGIRQGVTNAPLGAIIFQCDGDQVEDVEGAFSYEDSGGGSCKADCCYSDSSHSWHVAQLGVLCENTATDDGYLYDASFFECTGDDLYPFYHRSAPYYCASGTNCGKAACGIEYGELLVRSEPSRFERCIQSPTGETIPEISPPAIDERPPGTYTSRFLAYWQSGTYGNRGDPRSSGCTEDSQVRFTCTNGVIELISSAVDSVNCTKTSDSVLDCGDNFQSSQLTGVEYECQSVDAVPTTSFDYLANSMSCSKSILAAGAFRAAQLGVSCDDQEFFLSTYVDCSEGSTSEFTWVEGKPRYSCWTRQPFPGSSAHVFQFSEQQIFTDHVWQNEADGTCFSFEPDPDSTPAPTPVNSSPTSEPNFRASYKADFQYYRGFNCDGPNPVVQVFCKGSSLSAIETSDTSIKCARDIPDDSSFGSAAECTSTCQGNDCSWLHLGLNKGLSTVKFGSIKFECEGDQVGDIEGSFTYTNSGNGACVFDEFGTDAGHNYHVARLGVLCPGAGPNPPFYDYDSRFFECTGDSVYPLSDRKFDYFCAAGWNYFGEAGTVEFGQLNVNSELEQFRKCIVSPRGLTIPEIPAPPVSPRPKGSYVSRFQANWLSGGSTERAFNTIGDCTESSNVRITCTNGNIELLNTTYDSVNCTKTDSGVLECSDLFEPTGRRTGVEYGCTSINAVPTTSFDYLPGELGCNSGSILSYGAFRNVQLGVYCETLAASQFIYSDQWEECSEKSNVEFFNTNHASSRFDARFTCGNYKRFFGDDYTVLEFDLLQIYMDHRWQNGASEECFFFTATEGTPSPTGDPTSPPAVSSPPTSSPVLPVPTSMPTSSPTSIGPTLSPSIVSIPTKAPNPRLPPDTELPTLEPSKVVSSTPSQGSSGAGSSSAANARSAAIVCLVSAVSITSLLLAS